MNLPDEDSYLKTREELIDQLTVLLGGRVAEQVVFGAVTTGAANDLQRVAEITHAMVHVYGMGTSDAAQRARPSTPAQLSDRHARASATRSSRRSPSRPTARRSRLITEHRDKLEEFAARCSATKCSSAPTSTASWRASRRSTAGASPPPRAAASRPRSPRTDATPPGRRGSLD